MAVFEYKGRDYKGELVEGKLEAETENQAADILVSRSIIPVEFHEANANKSFSLASLFTEKVGLDEMQILTCQMYSLTRSGIPMLRAIKGLAETTISKKLKVVLEDITEQLTTGKSLSSAMKMHSDVFDNLFISMVSVGENTGKLEEVFLQLSNYFEREQTTRKQIKGAMRYPLIVLFTIAIALVILNIFVIPQFASMFSNAGAELPLPTKILIASSEFFLSYWPLMLASIIGSFFGFKAWKKTEQGIRKWDKFRINMPVIGTIVFRATLARYCRTLSMMLGAGVPITQALDLVSEAVDNAYMGDKIRNMKAGIEAGESMLRVSKQSGLFTPLILQMVAVGDETGQIENLLNDGADFYEKEVDYELKNITDKIEPILIGFIAGIVIILALGIYLPMWDMINLHKIK